MLRFVAGSLGVSARLVFGERAVGGGFGAEDEVVFVRQPTE